MKGIKFQHITDEMYIGKEYSDIKIAIDEMHKKTKEKLSELEYLYGIEYSIGEPYFLDWNSQKDSEYKKYGQKRNQRRYNITIRKDKKNRKITRNNIYGTMNMIYCTSYDDC